MEAKPALALTAALALGAAAGYVAGQRHPSPATEPPGTPSRAADTPVAMRATPGTNGVGGAAPAGAEAAPSLPTGDWAADLAAAMALPSAVARADRLRELAAAAPLAEVVRILDVAQAVLPGEALALFGERLLQRLALTDPLKALALADRQQGRSDDDHSHAWRAAILEAWVDHDVAAVVRWYSSLAPGTPRNRSQYQVASILGRRAPSQGLALTRSLTASAERREFASTLLAEWANLDPKSALNAASEFFKLPKDTGDIGRLIGAWARRDAPAATAHLRSLGDGPAQARLARVVLSHLAEFSGAMAADLLPRFPSAMRHAGTVHEIINQWARQDSQAALRWAEGLEDATLRRVALGGVMEWASNEDPKVALDLFQRHRDEPFLVNAAARSFGSDPQAGLRWIETLPSRRDRDNAFSGLLEAWAQLNAKEAAQHVATLPPGDLRNNALNTVALQLAQAQPDAVVDWVKSLGSTQERIAVSSQLAWHFASQDPEQGVALLESLPKGSARNQAMANFASTWAENDLDGAVAWMKAQKDSKARKDVLANVVGPWSSSDPAAAAAYIATLSASDVDPGSWSNVAANWASKSPKDALDWAQSLPGAEASQQAIQAAVTQWAERSPTEALAFAQSLSNPELRQQSVEAAFQSWGGSNPAEAAAALAKIPDPAARSTAATQVVGQWAEKDPVAAAAWLAQQPEAIRTDEVLQSLSSQLVQFEPQTALQWAATIQDENARNGAIEQAAQQWFQQAPDEAAKWLEGSGLPPEVIQRIQGEDGGPDGAMPNIPRIPFQTPLDTLKRRYGL